MTAHDLAYVSASRLAQLVARREVSPVEVVQAFLARCERLNPLLHAFCTIDPDAALRDARAAEAAVTRGAALGPLHGVPVSIKDLVFTRGLRTTFGSAMHEDFVPEVDEIVVARLRGAGAIVVGKTNTCEFGYKAVTDNRLFGATCNPWDPTRTPSGSSGGAGAAVAAGLGPIAIGSDGGGSIRCPASACGVFGYKPSRGRVPIHPLLRGWETLDRRVAQLGPLTRDVADAALVMDVIAGPDDRDPTTLPDSPAWRRELGRGIRGFRVAVSLGLNGAVVAPEVRGAVQSAAARLVALGCTVEEAEPELPALHDAYQRLFAADAAGAIGDRLDAWRERLDRGFARLVELGLSLTAADYVRAQNGVHQLWSRIQPLFERFDLLVTPTLPVTPFALGIDWPREVSGTRVHPLNLLAFTYPFNLTGQPAASVPCRWSADGLPIGLQIVGRRGADADVLRAAAAFEAAWPWHDRRPEAALTAAGAATTPPACRTGRS